MAHCSTQVTSVFARMGSFLLLFLASALSFTSRAASVANSDVQAIFDRNCIKCHGPLEHKSGLELDTTDAALQGNRDGPVIVPGKPAESKIMAVLSPDSDPHMPPKKQLSAENIATVRTWIAGLPANATKAGAGLAAAAAKALKPLDLRRVPAQPTAAIDYILGASWKRQGIRPTAICDDRTFVRRVYLDLAGRIPTRDEAQEFLHGAKPEKQKRARLIDKLLASDEYARAFRELWDVLLMGRHNGRREKKRRESGWYAFLEDAFRKGRPWNEVVRDLIIARPQTDETKGAVEFLFEKKNEPQQMAEAIAPVIYGTSVACAQCHDHPLAREIKQAHYWGLVTAFNRSKNVEGGEPAVSESATGGFVNFTNLKKESQPATMCLLTGRTIDETRPAADTKEEDKPQDYVDAKARARVPKFSRRAELAGAVTEKNPLLARAFVNYTWAILLGRGIVHPVDEMNSKHPPSQPELLDWLANDFASHDYDTKRLVRSIALSRAYQLAPWTGPKGKMPAPETFAAALEKPLTAEMMARSARIASGRSPDDETLRQAFVEAFPDVLPRTPRATIQQSLFLANNETFAVLFKAGSGTEAEALGKLPKAQDRVREAFAVTLGRLPDHRELGEGTSFLETSNQGAAEAAGELLWSLVAGPEFLTNH
jgi:mono/diheme cytochrome c family protein